MITSLMILQAIVSVLLIILVLLQFGKGAEAGLMSSTSDSIFTSSQQGNILSKMTVVLAIIFLGNSLLLAKMQGAKSNQSILDSEAPITQPLNSSQAKKDSVAKPVDAKAVPAAKEAKPAADKK